MSSRANGSGETEDLDKRRKEARKAKEKSQERRGALQDAFNANGQLSEGFIKEIVSAEDLEVGAPKGVNDADIIHTRTVAKLKNLLSRDWVLGHLTAAQEHDARHMAEVIRLKVLGLYPRQESHVQGEFRAFLMNDKEENITTLTAQERILIDELVETLKTRFGRGRDGFERKQENTSISRAETDRERPDESSGGFSLFS